MQKKIREVVRLISVTKEHWGPGLPKDGKMKSELLPLSGEFTYTFTGKRKPSLKPNTTLVFRYKGILLGEAKFIKKLDSDGKRIKYGRCQPYRERVKASEYITTGRSAYAVINQDQIKSIRKASETSNSGPYPKTGEKESVTTHRIGQGYVRELALERYEETCALCEIDVPELLVAGHIQGWAKGKRARSNPTNVILMCALHDSLFGKGFISLDPKSYRLGISTNRLSAGTRKLIRQFTSKFRKPKYNPPAQEFLEWHRAELFDKSE